jgi:hypothetical protein
MELIPNEESVEALDRCGGSTAAGLFRGAFLKLENGNLVGLYYRAILSRIRYNPFFGISSVEDTEAPHKVQIEGRQLACTEREPWAVGLYQDLGRRHRHRDQSVAAAEVVSRAGAGEH